MSADLTPKPTSTKMPRMYVSLLLDRRSFIGSGQHAKGAKGAKGEEDIQETQ
jgi:hypothetical protein